ncbi:Glycosyl hydrolases family 2, sugar binding domain [Lutibacter agarilyticus]|uniref:Glycosyl hydrolases family 2, sugar binding domain n=1 Tax=Lutibacter agarilyticus TaxID=1109740 RepID=A0A238YK78_9FLAO|nr:glycosyl hydrolase [Lutibacter agarilyticus]SNR71033.1 Glycosyl hydrolases family 2, sugar binding domain [Lutibacter agarilyticus]
MRILLLAILLLCVQCKTPNENTDKKQSDITPNFNELSKGFQTPEMAYHPETWFHFNGNNIGKEGITLDLEAIKYAGIKGIHLFSKNGRIFPGVEQIKVLSPEWEDMVRHTADECKRLGLKFTMQNCPGWSMTGGPWVPVEEAQREIVETVYRLEGGKEFNDILSIDSLYKTPDYDYKDVQVVAFPTPEGDDTEKLNPSKIESNNAIVPWDDIFNPNSKIIVTAKTTRLDKDLKQYRAKGIAKVEAKNTWVKTTFKNPVTLRSVVFPPLRHIIMDTQYPRIDVTIKVQALIKNTLTEIAVIKLPDANWNDRQKQHTMAIPETTSKEFVFTFEGAHVIQPEFIHLTSKPRLHNHEAKAAKTMRRIKDEITYHYAENTIIPANKIVNLSEKMTSEGKLTWNVPQGNWTVVRFGHINMRLTNKPAMPESTGWESSKLDKIAIENHLRNGMIGKMIKDGGPIGDGKLNGLLIDSWESHVPTWTMNSEDMFLEFEQRRGYSMKKYLPATMGYIVESPEVTTKFLRDIRQTMDDVYIDNFFSHFATVAHEMGAEVYTEGAGGEVLPIDPMRYYGVSDIPMTEFWYPKSPSSQNEYAKPIFSAASATHLYNKPLLAAEACTQVGVKWNEHPFDVKYLIDYNFTKGVNHLVFHTFSHTPQTNVAPGSSFGGNIGFPLVRAQTWWKYMPNWIDYLSRNQYMLQQGEYVADVLWYYGDHFERPPFDLDYFPKGYRFDYLNEEILQSKLAVKDGKINVKHAGDYRIILLRDSNEMLLSTIQKLKELVIQGAVIVGDKPMGSPSLMDDANDLKMLKSISDELWGTETVGVKTVGLGKVYWGQTIDAVLKAESITPDVTVPEGLPIHWIHRKTADADIYFVSTTSDKCLDVSLSFRVANAHPQLWNAFTGEQQDAMVWSQENEKINVAISFDPSGSAIVVFPKGDKQPFSSKVDFENETILSAENGWYNIHSDANFTRVSKKGNNILASKSGTFKFYEGNNVKSIEVTVNETSLQNNWKASFEKGWDTPESIEVPQLKSLTNFDNEAIQHYSGTATYTKDFNLESVGKYMSIDLGEVANIAEVWCNGKKVATRWAPPYRFDLSENLIKGKNTLEIKVTNTWRNQLIYDNTRSTENKKTWTTNKPKKEDTTLDKAGLIGPVVLKTIN